MIEPGYGDDTDVIGEAGDGHTDGLDFDQDLHTNSFGDDTTQNGAPDIVLDHDDLGPATLDLDHDGTPDSVITATVDGSVFVVTDADHDGVADGYLEIDASGQVVNAGGTDDQYLGTTEHTAEPASTDGEQEAIQLDGQQYSLGAATFDSADTGTPDTAFAFETGGTVIAYTDADHDGVADHLTEVGSDGTVTTAYEMDDGSWTISGIYHADADGTLVPQQLPDGSMSDAAPPATVAVVAEAAQQHPTAAEADNAQVDIGVEADPEGGPGALFVNPVGTTY